MIATNIAYFSNLKPDFDPEELCRTLYLGATQEEVVQDVIVHGNQAAFVGFSDRVFVDLVVKHYHGKFFLGSVVSVSGLTKELEQILIQLWPGDVISQLQEVKSTQSGKLSSQSKVSDVMAAISGLNSDEKLQIKAALFGMTTDTGVKDTYGGSKAFGMVLTAMKRSIKGQAQEIVLHMGEDAAVSDILTRFEMMFGDVDPPHVLLAQFYNLEQTAGEGITDWYSRVEDLASRIIREDATVISPDNYGIVVNTQFWTRLFGDNIKNALRHKFETFAGSPQFIIEARKIDSEFKSAKLKAQQQQMITEPTPSFQKGLDEILQRLSSLEKKVADKTVTDPSLGTSPASGNSFGAGQTQGNTRPKVPRKNWKDIQCYRCHKFGHIAKRCHLTSTRSEGRSGLTEEH